VTFRPTGSHLLADSVTVIHRHPHSGYGWVPLEGLMDLQTPFGNIQVSEDTCTVPQSQQLLVTPPYNPVSDYWWDRMLACCTAVMGKRNTFAHHEMGLASVNEAWQFFIVHSLSLGLMHRIKPKSGILG
jgi:hypothetical protein